MKKTILEWLLEDAPRVWRDMALSYYFQKFSLMVTGTGTISSATNHACSEVGRTAYKLSDALNSAFTWADTQQGSHYWSSIHDDLVQRGF